MNYLKAHKNEIAIIFAFFLLPWLLCYNPNTMIMGDNLRAAYPAYELTIQKIFSGSSLLWNEYILAGHPFLAEIVNGVLYPPRLLLYLILPVKWAYIETILLHFSLTGWFAYLYLRCVHISKFPAFFGGIILMLCPIYRIQILDSISLLHTITWLPLIMYFMEKRITSGEKKFLLFAACAFVIQVLAGFTQDSFYTAITVVIYSALRYYNKYQNFSVSFKCFFHDMIIFGLIVASFSAIQLLPTQELFLFAQHYQLGWNLIEQYSTPPLGFLTFINPFFWGGFKNGGIQTDYYLASFTNNNYFGIVTILFAIYALKFWKNNVIKIWSILLILSLIIASGIHVMPVAKFLYAFPLTHAFRFHTRIYFVASMAVVVLFAYGLDRLLQLDKNTMRQEIGKILKLGFLLEGLVFICLCGLIIGINFFKDTHNIIQQLINYHNIADLQQYYKFSNVALFDSFIVFIIASILLWLLPNVKKRAFILSALLLITMFELWIISNGLKVSSSIFPSYANVLLKVKPILMPTERIILIDKFGIQEASSMHHMMHSLNGFVSFDERSISSIRQGVSSLADIATMPFFLNQLQSNNGFLSMLGLKYFIIDNHYSNDVDAVHAYKKIMTVGDYTVYENHHAKPRVYSVDDIRWENGVAYSDINLNNTAVLNGNLKGTPKVGIATIQKIIYSAGNVNSKVNCPSVKCLVILSESYFPGWKSYVDDKKNDLYKVNDLIMGTFVDKGEHWVKFYYLPTTVVIGIFLFVLGLIWVPVWMLWPRKY